MTSENALRGAMFIALALAALLRWCVSMHPYSGQGTPPRFGDYEAQRHWMEITYNLPIQDWYFNTSHNDLNYWGLDYPPITAYHSYICGYISNHMNPAYVVLNSSRGYESYEHKLFMRASVFVADFLIYIPAVWWYFSYKKPTSAHRSSFRSLSSGVGVSDGSDGGGGSGGGGSGGNGRGDGQPVNSYDSSNSQILALFLALVYPGLILIDYGHFQYNNISLGLTVAAVAALYRGFELSASILFCFALNYKQMELYHALPFFCYLLGSCLPNKEQPLRIGLIRLIKIGLIEVEDLSDGCGAKFNALIVSSKFEGKPLLQRHRLVNSILSEELKSIHAFSQKTMTPKEWDKQNSQ
ncbi:Alpha-1,3-glucosyltransferase [Gryllus bimaculatus]|nr:Alpha-1,3-glucosyltransferase [Gryllus bimaculatus]